MNYSPTGNGDGMGTRQNQKNSNATPNPTSKTLNGMNLEKPDLIKLLGVMEGELQAREIVIAVEKNEQIKHLIYPMGQLFLRPGPRNPFTQLWQDVICAHDKSPCVDVNSINNLQQVQAKLLDNMISQNNELLMKIKAGCCTDCMNCSGLQSSISIEQIVNREAKEESDRIIDAETKASLMLEQVREREKRIVLLLLGERQRLMQKLETTRTNCQELLRALRQEKMRNNEMVDGLEEESKRSLLMEEQMETASKQHIAQKRQFQAESSTLREENSRQAAEIQRLRAELEKLSTASGGVRSQVVSSAAPQPARSGTAPTVCAAPAAQRSIAEEPTSAVKPGRSGDRPVPPPVPPNKPVILRKPAHLTGGATAPTSSPATAASTGDQPQQSDPLDSEIKTFQNVFVAMKSTSPTQPNSPPTACPTDPKP